MKNLQGPARAGQVAVHLNCSRLYNWAMPENIHTTPRTVSIFEPPPPCTFGKCFIPYALEIPKLLTPLAFRFSIFFILYFLFYFYQTLQNYQLDSQIFLTWLILLQNISNDSTSVLQYGWFSFPPKF